MHYEVFNYIWIHSALLGGADSAPVSSGWSFFSPFAPVVDAYDRLSQWRADLGLPSPGTVENLQREIKTTLLNNSVFDGARADLTKNLSMNPLFQVTHSLSLGSQAVPPSYSFMSVYSTDKVFMQGGLDHEGSFNMRLHNAWTPALISKVQAQFSANAGNGIIFEQDYQGRDYSVNLKAINPWPLDLTGVYVGSYFQSLNKNIALGLETVCQRLTPMNTDFTTSYLARYTSTDKNWIATALTQVGILQATYWQRLSEKVEVAAELTLQSFPGRPREASAQVGAKYEMRMATFRAQLDSGGKVSTFLEQRITPAFQFMLSGEIDHFKNAAKFGFGVMLESSDLTPEEMGMPPQPTL
ncbi:mitochondrial import receptor subunit tom40 [Fistulina hepatica ATCC 64428]|nr:mitochondrial import receptor subunit tom40 [Fistulina hepatica ATCC 64428]